MVDGERQRVEFFTFVDGGKAFINDPLPQQASLFDLWSWGVGGRSDYLRTSTAGLMGVPMITQAPSYHTTLRKLPDSGVTCEN